MYIKMGYLVPAAFSNQELPPTFKLVKFGQNVDTLWFWCAIAK